VRPLAADTPTLDVGPVAGGRSRSRAVPRAYEPVLRFTEGELLLSTAVDPHVAQCNANPQVSAARAIRRTWLAHESPRVCTRCRLQLGPA
jgi:hypothetical protein